MIKTTEYIARIAAQKTLSLAELALWGFVGVGVIRVLLNGINGISSLMIGISMGLFIVSLAFYFLAFSCKVVENSKKGVKDEL